MNSLWLTLSINGAYLALFLLPIGLVSLWRIKLANMRRSPLTKKLLRAPGETLGNELEETRVDLLAKISVLTSLPILMFATHISQSYFLGAKESLLRAAIILLMGGGAVIYLLWDMYKLGKRLTRLRQGYEGEVAIAQELNMLMRDGAYVYHDVPAEGFNIDHVIVSSKGVYAVETKSRMKPKRDLGAEDAKVIFDGRTLQFPGWFESEPLEQAARQARWLERWLTSAVGEKVGVKPVLALPGWYVDRKGKSDVVIINGTNAPTVFSKLFHAQLSEEMMKCIAHQLDQRCRDVEPAHFQKRDKIS